MIYVVTWTLFRFLTEWKCIDQECPAHWLTIKWIFLHLFITLEAHLNRCSHFLEVPSQQIINFSFNIWKENKWWQRIINKMFHHFKIFLKEKKDQTSPVPIFINFFYRNLILQWRLRGIWILAGDKNEECIPCLVGSAQEF